MSTKSCNCHKKCKNNSYPPGAIVISGTEYEKSRKELATLRMLLEIAVCSGMEMRQCTEYLESRTALLKSKLSDHDISTALYLASVIESADSIYRIASKFSSVSSLENLSHISINEKSTNHEAIINKQLEEQFAMAKQRVLVVDDEPGIRELISDILSPHGHSVLCAENGTQALHKLSTNTIDVVYLDIRMPDGDGLTTLKKISNNWPNISVIMITGCGQREVIDKTLELGAYACLVKPFGVNDVIGMLELAKAA